MSTLPETNSSPLKMDSWNTTFLLGRPIFRGYVSFREGSFFVLLYMCWIRVSFFKVVRKHLVKKFYLLQHGPLLVINGVISPINGLINGVSWGYNPLYGPLLITGDGAHFHHRSWAQVPPDFSPFFSTHGVEEVKSGAPETVNFEVVLGGQKKGGLNNNPCVFNRKYL